MNYVFVAWVTIVLIILLILALERHKDMSGKRPKGKRKKDDIVGELRKIIGKIKINVRL